MQASKGFSQTALAQGEALGREGVMGVEGWEIRVTQIL